MKTIWVIRSSRHGENGEPVAAYSDEAKANEVAKQIWPRGDYDVVEIHLDPPGMPA